MPTLPGGVQPPIATLPPDGLDAEVFRRGRLACRVFHMATQLPDWHAGRPAA